MNDDNLASDSGKTATQTGGSSGGTPFDEIVALEEKEQERLRKELDGMQQEADELAQRLAKSEEEEHDKLKAAAKDELKQYKDSELASILKTAESDGNAKQQTLQSAYDKNADVKAKELANMVLDSEFLAA